MGRIDLDSFGIKWSSLPPYVAIAYINVGVRGIARGPRSNGRELESWKLKTVGFYEDAEQRYSGSKIDLRSNSTANERSEENWRA